MSLRYVLCFGPLVVVFVLGLITSLVGVETSQALIVIAGLVAILGGVHCGVVVSDVVEKSMDGPRWLRLAFAGFMFFAVIVGYVAIVGGGGCLFLAVNS